MKTFGLTTQQVAESKAKHGDNSLTQQQGEGLWPKFLGNLGDPMIKILCVALIINVVFTILGFVGVISEGAPEWYESVGIALAVLIATLVSTFSEYRNENAFQKLQEEASKIVVKAYRNGEIIEISIDDIVVGDCLLVQSGDKMPADGVVVDGDIKVDQSVLNGESKEARKTVIPEGYKDPDTSINFLNEHKVFRGSVVCSGNAIIQVSVVGDKSVYGEIAKELQQDDDRETPLKVKLRDLADGISKFGYIGGALIAVALLVQRLFFQADPLFGLLTSDFATYWPSLATALINALMLAVIIIVMAVPEGLPLMIAIVSALNMGKMLKDNVLVRKINGIETAGSLNILFSDKTGTITKGKLEAILFLNGEGKEYKNITEVKGQFGRLLALSIKQNTSSVLSGTGKDARAIGGNATERAILSFAASHTEAVDASVVASIPFNSTNKYSASQVKGEFDLSLIKGAPERLMDKCKYYYDESGKQQELTKTLVDALTGKIDALADRAIRVLAVATSSAAIVEDQLPEGDWALVGIIGIRDEVRPESITAIKEVKSAGVQVVMITGDRKETAVAIAKEAGLLENKTDIVLTSDELSNISDDELKKMIPNIRVIARALPSDKSRLVRNSQELNLVVGMTGDGVNDSPALKAADVGFAMGGGTEVAKEASEIIIMDDNFSSIDKAILYGRTIFNSIRKFIIFQLTINVAAVLITFVAPLIPALGENPLTITQILWVNLVMDTLAALAFGGEPALKRFMNDKPKRRDESIVSKYMWSSILTGSFLIFVLSLVFLLAPFVSDYFRVDTDPSDVIGKYLRTGYFAFFIFISAFNAFNARTDKHNLFDNIGRNKGFLQVIGLIAAVQIIMVYVGGVILDCYGLELKEWIVVLVFSVIIIPVDLIRKSIVKSS